MDFLVWLIIMIVIGSFSGGNKKKGKSSTPKVRRTARRQVYDIPENPDYDAAYREIVREKQAAEAPEYRQEDWNMPFSDDEMRDAAQDYNHTPVGEWQMEQREPQPQPDTKPTVLVYGSLGELLREMQQGMQKAMGDDAPKKAQIPYSQMDDEEISRRKAEVKRRRDLRRRKTARPATVAVDNDADCGYCTGDVVVPSVFGDEQTIVPSKPLASPQNTADTGRTVAAACQGLSPLQQAVVWKEVLDKPLALRRR